jgi:uncharacterized membrane protein YjgN (DUF898 family)
VLSAVLVGAIAALALNGIDVDELPPALLGVGFAAAYSLMVIPFAYNRAGIANALYSGITVGTHRVVSEQQFVPLLKIYVTNFLGIIFSLGLATPWAKVRLAAYRAERMKLLSIGSLDVQRYDMAGRANAVGDAATDLGDMGFDLGV